MTNNKILIIDDENEIVALLARVLRKQGYHVLESGNLIDGWKQLECTRPSLVFLDINLPDGNGLQVLPDIRKSYPRTQVIMISAYDTLEDRNKATINGACNFLSKPFNLHQVVSLVKALEHQA